jgi:hypothetical protein
MFEFCYSPGINALVDNVTMTEFVLVMGLAYAAAGPDGLELAIAANAFGLSVYKLVTDYLDPADALVAIAGLIGGGLALFVRFRSSSRPFRSRMGLRVGAVVIVALGFNKIAFDPCDPFDILLGCTLVLTGGLVWLHTKRTPPIGAAPAPPPSSETDAPK